MPNMAAARGLSPPVCSSVASISRRSTAASVMPTLTRNFASCGSKRRNGSGSRSTSIAVRPRAVATSACTTWRNSRTLPGQT